ncbi:hypothetical protein LBMAG42_28470 [Deltaproteobacteria bacterium]|nr:hypothetical protein LBMAG42_28470 [Deltaproteobacteria bacterium]
MIAPFLLLIGAAFSAVPVAEYDAVRAALAADNAPAAAAAATTLAADATLDPLMLAPARAVAAATDIVVMRVAFAELSRTAILALGLTPAEKVQVYKCPMAPNYQYWMQAKAGLANPYFGKSMLTCGEGVAIKVAYQAALAANK